MPLMKAPNGQYVNIEDGTPPEVVARIMSQFKGKPAAATAAAVSPAAQSKPQLTPEQQEVQRRLAFEKKTGVGTDTGLTRMYMRGLGSHAMDEITGAASAGTLGVYNAIKHGDIHEIGKEYHVARDVERAKDQEAAQGTGSTLAEIAGALANPVGTGAKALQALKFAPRIANIGMKLERAPALLQGAVAGLNQGALNAAGAADNLSDVPGHAAQGALAGFLSGGALGALAHGGQRAFQILADRGPQAAERIAYSKIADMLAKAGIRPAAAERELAVTNARGGDGMIQDMTPGLRAQAGALSRRPDVAASNDMIDRGEQRLLDRAGRFEAEIRNRVQPSTGVDADAHLAGLNAARKAHGATDYEAALDGRFHWDENLQKFMDTAPAEVHAAMREGAHLAVLHDQDIGKLGMKIGPDGGITMEATPSMRVFDYTKRAMDAKIANALKSGNNSLAAGLSNQLGKFKKLIMDANPDYAPILATQRDYFEKAKATELGLGVVSRLKREPKKVLAELRALDPDKQDDARTGIADAIIALRSQKQDPVQFFASVARTPEQRKVLEFTFGGKGNLGRFERWMNRELRARKADVLTAPGRQSETARFQSADNSLNEGIGGVAEHGLRGFAFGGSAGMSAAIVRKFNDLRTGMSPHALEEMAQALMSDGEKLTEKTSAVAAFNKTRKVRNARRAVMAAKAGQQPVTDYSGN